MLISFFVISLVSPVAITLPSHYYSFRWIIYETIAFRSLSFLKPCTMATVDVPVGLATDPSKYATIPAIHKEVALGQAATEMPPSKPTLKQLTIEEKVQLLSGIDFASTAGVARLGIPSLKVGLNTGASRHYIG